MTTVTPSFLLQVTPSRIVSLPAALAYRRTILLQLHHRRQVCDSMLCSTFATLSLESLTKTLFNTRHTLPFVLRSQALPQQPPFCRTTWTAANNEHQRTSELTNERTTNSQQQRTSSLNIVGDDNRVGQPLTSAGPHRNFAGSQNSPPPLHWALACCTFNTYMLNAGGPSSLILCCRSRRDCVKGGI